MGLGCATGLAPKRIASRTSALAIVLAALPFAWLPLRSRFEPAIDIGDPESLDRFWTVVRAEPYTRHWLAGSLDLGVARLGRHLAELPAELGLAALLGPVGVFVLSRRPRGGGRVALALGGTLVANALVGVGYDVLDYQAYFLPSTWVLALASAFALDAAIARARPELSGVVGVAALGAVAPLFVASFSVANLAGYGLARELAEDVLEAAPEDALVVVEGDTAIHALWYLQAVEGARPDVIVLSPGHLFRWYCDQLEARHPDEPWPTCGRDPVDSRAQAHAIVRALSARHPIFLTGAVASEPYLDAGPHGGRFGAVPRGVGTVLLPFGSELDLLELADFTAPYFERAMARVLPVPETVDVESASIYLEYALALSRTGDLFARSARPELARRAYGWVLELRADELDAIVRDDVWEGLGQRIPALGLGDHAHDALEALGER